MNKVYVLNFNDNGIYCVYATKEAAKKVLWECYCDEVLPAISDTYAKEDAETLREDSYIIDYGWVEEVTFVNE
jgi:hypothetical protein